MKIPSTLTMKFQSQIAAIALLLCFFLSCGQLVSKQADGSLNILVVGDWGRKGLYNQSQVAYQMGRIAEDLDVDFIISTGDNFYEDGLTGVSDPAFLQSFSQMYTAKSLQKPWYAVLGNHDYRGDVLAQLDPVLKEIDSRWLCQRSFTLKYNLSTLPFSSANDLECPSTAELYFVDTSPFVDKYWKIPNEDTYDWRGVVPRDTYLRQQLQDLETGLRSSNATWKLVIGHHTLRSVGDHGDTEELVQQLLPILEKYNVDLYINGHDHCLEHIKSLTSPIQFLTSGGGSKAWRGMKKGADMTGLEMFYDGQGFMILKITQKHLYAIFYDIEGNIIHQVELSRNQTISFKEEM